MNAQCFGQKNTAGIFFKCGQYFNHNLLFTEPYSTNTF